MMIGIVSANKFAAGSFSKATVDIAYQYADEILRRVAPTGLVNVEDDVIDWNYRGELGEWEKRGRTFS